MPYLLKCKVCREAIIPKMGSITIKLNISLSKEIEKYLSNVFIMITDGYLGVND